MFALFVLQTLCTGKLLRARPGAPHPLVLLDVKNATRNLATFKSDLGKFRAEKKVELSAGKSGKGEHKLATPSFVPDPHAPSVVQSPPSETARFTKMRRDSEAWGEMVTGFRKALGFVSDIRTGNGLPAVAGFPKDGLPGTGPPILAVWTKVVSGIAFKVCTKLTVSGEQEFVVIDFEGASGTMTAVTPETALGHKATLELLGAMGEGESVEEVPGDVEVFHCNHETEEEAKRNGWVGHHDGSNPFAPPEAAAPVALCDTEEELAQAHRSLGLLQVEEQYRTSYEKTAEKRRGKYDHMEHPKEYNFRFEHPDCAMKVKDQGQCGSCYAFGLAASGGERLCLRSKRNGETNNVALSQQDLVSCGSSGGVEYETPFCTNGERLIGHGCDGGFTFPGLWYLHALGLPDLACAPYASGGGDPLNHFDVHGERVPLCADIKSEECRQNQGKNRLGVPIMCPAGDKKCIKSAIMDGPVVASFSITAGFMARYPGGFDEDIWAEAVRGDQACREGNYVGGHAIQLFGWGVSEKGVEYWWARNSWGDSWGLEGNFKIRATNEGGIENFVGFNALDVDDNSAYETDCVKVREEPNGCILTNVCEDIREVVVKSSGAAKGGQCHYGGTNSMSVKPGKDYEMTLADQILCAVWEDKSGGPFDPSTHYKEATELLHSWGLDWVECGMENTYPGEGDLCLCCGYNCACVPAGGGYAALSKEFCSAEVCAANTGGGVLEEVVFA